MLQDVSTKRTVVVKRGVCGLRQAVWAMPGLTLRGSPHFRKQLAHARLGFVLFGALLALMFFLGLAGLGAGGFPLGFGRYCDWCAYDASCPGLSSAVPAASLPTAGGRQCVHVTIKYVTSSCY